MKHSWIILAAAIIICAIVTESEAIPLNCQDNAKQVSNALLMAMYLSDKRLLLTFLLVAVFD